MPQSSKDIWISSTYKHKWILKKKFSGKSDLQNTSGWSHLHKILKTYKTTLDII